MDTRKKKSVAKKLAARKFSDMKNELLGPTKYAKKKQKKNNKKSVESSLLGEQVNLILSRLNHPRNTCQTHLLVTSCGLGLDLGNELSTKMSHSQLLSLVSCLTDCPREKEKIRLAAASWTPPGIGEIHPVSKTPLSVLRHCLDAVECSISAEPDLSVLGKASDDAFIIIGNVNPFTKSMINNHQQVVVHARLHSKKAPKIQDMQKLETVVLYLPSAGVFYSRFFLSAITANKPLTESQAAFASPSEERWYIPQPATSLRIKRHSGQVALGGFLANVTSTYRIKKKVTNLMTGDTTYLQAHAFPDSEIFIVPNFIHPKMKCDEVDKDSFSRMSPTARRKVWLKLLLSSRTLQSRCKKFVGGLLYNCISTPPDSKRVYVVDSASLFSGNEINLRILSHKKKVGSIDKHSTIRIRRMQSDDHPTFLKSASKLQEYLAVPSSGSNSRKNEDTYGRFLSFGQHVYNGNVIDYPVTKDVPSHHLAHFMQEYRKLLRKEFPYETASIVSQWRSKNVFPHTNMGGADSPSLSLNTSINLGNAPHTDNLDVGVGVSIWTEDRPGTAKGWYFVLPNLLVSHKNTTYQGVMVRLSHGAAITWDGTCIRHCTTVTEPGRHNNVYGLHVTNNMNTLKTLGSKNG